ncbi:heat shock protein 70 [Mycena olivaceomarginata]|nr:heat shock protein 70 [Mycena olivaceomarginata]
MSSFKAIGIDLGTTYSCVGVWQNDRVEIIANDHGNRATPSYVSFSDNERLIGDAAKVKVFGAKRLIGRNFNDVEVQADLQHLPFTVFNKGGKPYIRSPEEISSMVLQKMKEISESYLGTPISNAVVTVPAYFNDSQRQATKGRRNRHGLDKRVSGEPECPNLRSRRGTFDVSLLTIEEGIFQVKAIAGNTHLGGEDFDNRLVNHFAQEFRRRYKKGISLPTSAPPSVVSVPLASVPSVPSPPPPQTSIEIDSLFQGIDFYASLTRARFEELCKDLFPQHPRARREGPSGLQNRQSNVDEIVLVGGSTRIPFIVKLVSDFFNGKKPNRVSTQTRLSPSVLPSTPHPLPRHFGEDPGCRTARCHPYLPWYRDLWRCHDYAHKRNTTIPTRKSESFSTESFSTETCSTKIFSSETFSNETFSTRTFSSYSDTRPGVAHHGLSGIPPALRGVPQIEITFDIDADGILNVFAADKRTGELNRINITYDKSRLSKEDIDRMVQEAEKYKDEAAVSRIAAKNGLESYTYDLQNSITELQTAVNETFKWLQVSPECSKEEYEEKLKELETVVTGACKSNLL